MTTTLTHEQVLDSLILPAWREMLPAGMRPQVDGFVRRNRPAIVKVVGVAWMRKLWADDLSIAQKRLAAELAEELERGVQVAEVLDAAIDLKTPGALELATDLPGLSAEDRKQRSAGLVRVLARGARESAEKKTTTPVDTAAAPEARTPAARARKNLAAMELAYAIEESGEPNDDDTRATLRGYSGWGGLSLDKYGSQFPEGWDPESPGLIHEYYTPSAVADAIAEAVCPMLEDLATPLGELNALEPSAGIGRFIDAFDRARCSAKPALTWTAVEFSDNSARLLGHIRPDVEVEHTTFETWVSRYGSALQGTFGLVVANPPYGERGTHAAEDPDRYYREKRASNYFLRRGLDLLAPQGIGVFLIPGGFLTGKNSKALRRKVLRRHHLAAAMRLPQQMFPGTSPRLQIDLLIFRSRGGELAEVDEADRFILDGGYYEAFPNHDLSETETFTGLPAFNERPQCVACVVNRYSWKRLASRPRSQVVSGESEFEKSLTPDLREALGVGGRVRRYLAAVSTGDPSALDLYGELLLDLQALAKQPKTLASIRTIAAKKDSINAEALVGVITAAGRVRVVVIGSEMHKLKGGKRVKAANKLLNEKQITADEHEQMLMTSRTDSSKDRGDKWVAFQSGLFDVAIVSYEAFPRTRVSEESLERYAERSESIMRSVELTIRTAEGKEPDKLTERQKAIKERGVRAWIEDKISSKHEPDPRITWEEIGVDLLVVDEAASFKNLHMPETREGGVPRYMGGGGRDGSKRAWNFDFRAGLVREATGGAGVVLLSATPAKNSPLEFYNMIQFIDGGAWADRGITDPEQFIDRYTRIATQNVVTPSFQIEAKPAVVGFTQLDELRSIVFRYSEWRKAKDVGIVLPRPRVCRCEVELDDAQRTKYQEFVAKIEKTLESGGNSGSILGYLARLGLVALHAQLDEGYTWKTALGGKTTRQVSGGALGHWVQQGWQVVPPDPAKKKKAEDDNITITRDLPTPDPSSPKFRAIAQRVVAQPSCGHIIFCEPTAAHAWIRLVLIEHGIPANRIAVLNAEVTKAAARVTIARDFNGEEGDPKYDVIIANSVAYEGIDLQVRTCAIHHADLPWTPADLEQRNGRAHRQGNQFSTLSIYYYLGKGSMDLFRYDLIQGKAGWLEDLIAGNPETSNPAAQAELTPEDYLIALSADPEKTRRLIEKKRAGDAGKKREAIIGTANRLFQRASVLFANAHREPSERAARSRAEGEELLDRLSKYSAVWPYGGLVPEARRQPIVLTSSAGVPIWEGLKLRSSATDFDFEFFEVGKQSASDATTISIREAGSAEWTRVHLADLNAAIDQSSFQGTLLPVDLMAHAMADVFGMAGMQQPTRGRSAQADNWWTWPEDDAVKMEKEARSLARSNGMEALLVLHFVGASDAFRTAVWPAIRDDMMKNPSGLLPVEREGALQLVETVAEGDELLPWTPWGYDRFLGLALESDLKVGDLVTVSRRWWDRAFPRALLKRTESETEAQAKESAPETPSASPSEVTAAVRAAESAQLTELAQTPEGYALLLAQLGKLAEIEDPLLIAPRFGDQWITDFTSKYTTQEAEGRQDTEPSEVWQTDEYLDQILERIREHILEEGAVVREDPQRVQALQVVPDGIRGTAEEGFYVLREDGADSSAADNRAGSSRRYIKLLDELSLDADVLVGVENIDHPGNQGPPLAAGDSIYTVGPDLDTETIEHNWATYKELAQSVRGAPTALEQARKAMVYARVLVQAPKCQGEAKRSALEFLRGAFVYYRNAQERVNQGAAGAAYANLRRVSRYLAREAYNLAESCAAGQLALVTPSPIDVGNVSDAALDASEEAGDPDYEAIEVSDDDEADDTDADDEDNYDADEES